MRVEIHTHAGIELRLGLAADHGREMEHGIGIGRERTLEQRRVGEVAGDRRDALVAGKARGNHVEQRDRRDLAHTALRVGEGVAREEMAGQTAAEKAGAAGDHDAHSMPPG